MDFLPWGPEEVPGFSCYHFNLPKLEAVDGGEGRACRGANENVTWSRRSGGGVKKGAQSDLQTQVKLSWWIDTPKTWGKLNLFWNILDSLVQPPHRNTLVTFHAYHPVLRGFQFWRRCDSVPNRKHAFEEVSLFVISVQHQYWYMWGVTLLIIWGKHQKS